MEVLAFTLSHTVRHICQKIQGSSSHSSPHFLLSLYHSPSLYLPHSLSFPPYTLSFPPSLNAWERSPLCWDGAEAGPQTFPSHQWLQGPAEPSYWQRCAPGQHSPTKRQTQGKRGVNKGYGLKLTSIEYCLFVFISCTFLVFDIPSSTVNTLSVSCVRQCRHGH